MDIDGCMEQTRTFMSHFLMCYTTHGSHIHSCFFFCFFQFCNNYSATPKNFQDATQPEEGSHQKLVWDPTWWYQTLCRAGLRDCWGIYRNPSLSCLQKAERPAVQWKTQVFWAFRILLLWGCFGRDHFIDVHCQENQTRLYFVWDTVKWQNSNDSRRCQGQISHHESIVVMETLYGWKHFNWLNKNNNNSNNNSNNNYYYSYPTIQTFSVNCCLVLMKAVRKINPGQVTNPPQGTYSIHT